MQASSEGGTQRGRDIKPESRAAVSGSFARSYRADGEQQVTKGGRIASMEVPAVRSSLPLSSFAVAMEIKARPISSMREITVFHLRTLCRGLAELSRQTPGMTSVLCPRIDDRNEKSRGRPVHVKGCVLISLAGAVFLREMHGTVPRRRELDDWK